jgi:hypothetical protein
MMQSAAAHARVGARLRTGPLLDNTNENMASRRIDGEHIEYLKDITHGDQMEHLKDVKHGEKQRNNNWTKHRGENFIEYS